MRTFRAYRIDPVARTVQQIAFQDHTTAYAEVGTNNLDHAAMRLLDESMLCLWVDGEGYYKPDLLWWHFADYPSPLAGVGVICGADRYGETADVPLTLAEITELVFWVEGRPTLPMASASTPDGVISEVDFNAPDAPTSLEEFYERLMGAPPPRKKP